MNYIKVKDRDHLYRNKENDSIINSDYESYKLYNELYKKKYTEKEKIKNLENDVNEIKNDLNEIKTLLRNLANGS
jgi:chromosome condensin MukBEF ATPase and DNA-binding subunit MukB